MGGVFRTLLNNLGSIILALLLAVAVWIAATLQADPFVTQDFVGLLAVPVDQPSNTQLFEGGDTRVSVTVRAPQSVLAELSTADFQVSMDLGKATIGVESTVPISVTVDNSAVRIQSYVPEKQIVLLEAMGTMTFPVQIDVQGQVGIGYQASLPTIRPREVQVFGPMPDLRQVVSVTGTININGAREDISQKVVVVPRDANGQPVSNVEVTPDQVDISISVRRRVGYKPDVEVVPDLRGDPAAGYRRGTVSVEPSTVTLAGPTAVLNNLPGFIKTTPITITAASADLTVRVPLSVPAGVVVVETNFVTVTIEILPILSSRTLTSTVEMQGLRQGWQATLSPPEVEVIVEGPETLLGQLTPNDLQVFVNLSGLDLGVNRVDPIVLAPASISVVSVIPETVEVDIELIPTPTPTATQPVTATLPTATAVPNPTSPPAPPPSPTPVPETPVAILPTDTPNP